MNDVIIIFNDVNGLSKEVRIFKGQLNNEELEIAKKINGHYINDNCDQDSEEYKALEYFYNEVLFISTEKNGKEEVKFRFEEIEEPIVLNGTAILIGYVNKSELL